MYRTQQDKGNWKEALTTEIVNGRNGNSLRYKHRNIVASYVRIGFSPEGKWYLHKLRSDFVPSEKIQMEDDISASITLPAQQLNNLNPEYTNKSVKLVTNCESYLFQRPDEAIIRGYDKESEADIVQPNTFLSNFEPLTKADAIELMEDAISFDQYTMPVQDLITQVAEGRDEGYFVAPSHTRLVNGVPTQNPRYLQRNVFKNETQESYLAEIGVRLFRKIQSEMPVHVPVNAVLPGRRNNPADKEAGIRALSVYNPIHYQEMPELFMDFICSLTGKSPSTTGAGSEGALTKGPFNMLVPTTDLNNALLSYILGDYQGFSSAAGYIGQEKRFDHDISILVPEIWARLEPNDRDAKQLIQNNCLEKLEDFEYKGQKVLASRAVFNEKMLKPELQGMEEFVDGINNIVEAQQKVALRYFEEGSEQAAIPPLKILLHIMAYGNFEGKDLSNPVLRGYFERDYVTESEWYKERLRLKQQKDSDYLKSSIKYLHDFMVEPNNSTLLNEMQITERLEKAQNQLEYVESEDYLKALVGTIGADPLFHRK